MSVGRIERIAKHIKREVLDDRIRHEGTVPVKVKRSLRECQVVASDIVISVIVALPMHDLDCEHYLLQKKRSESMTENPKQDRSPYHAVIAGK